MFNKIFFFITILFGYSLMATPFADKENGTIVDTKAKLIWQKCGEGQNPLTCEGEATQVNWMQANLYCGSLELANKKWRLPKREEIAGLLDLSVKEDSKIDQTAFPKTAAYRYWSSTVSNPKGNVVWTTHFFYGDEKRTKKEDKGYARCVSQ